MGTYRDPQAVTLSCSDPAGPGCDSTFYCLGTGCSPSTPYSGPIPITASTTLRFYSKDTTGKSEEVKSYDYAIDSTQAYRFERLWPHLDQPWYFKLPSAVTVDLAGNVYVADPQNGRAVKLTGNGEFVTKITIPSDASPSGFGPSSLATDSSGNLYAINGTSIAKFDSNGAYVKSWGSLSPDYWRLNLPNSVAADLNGKIYVTDVGNNVVHIYSNEGTLISDLGGAGSGNGQFTNPSGVAIDAQGNVYVGDTGNQRIQKFTADGTFVSTWSTPFCHHLFVDSQGYLYAANAYTFTTEKFDGNGNALGSYQGSSLAVDANGNTFILNQNGDGLKKWSSNGIAEWQSSGWREGQFDFPTRMASDSKGNVYVLQARKNRIQKFDGTGNLLREWQPNGFSAMATDANDNLYLVTGDGLLSKYNSEGNLFYSLGLPPSTGSWGPGIAVDHAGNIFLGNSNNVVQKFDKDGNFLLQAGGPGSDPGQFNNIISLAVDSNGNLFTTDSNFRVQKFDTTGAFAATIGSWGDFKGIPYELATDSDDNLYVGDQGLNHRVLKFDKDGNYLTELKGKGTGNGEFDVPYGIAVDPNRNVYLADTYFNRIQKFNLAAAAPGAPTGVTATADTGGQAVVSFTPATDDGGSPILFYTVTSNPGNVTATGTGSPVTVTGITNGIPVTFTVTASNAAGAGAPSVPSNAVTAPLTPPGAPANVAAIPGNGQATITFTKPKSDGGSPITFYTVTVNPGGATVTGAAAPLVFPGLANGQSYSFTVTATNAIGTGDPSLSSAPVVPEDVPPVTNADPPGGSLSPGQNVTLSCNDGNGSGCASTWYCLGSSCTPGTLYKGAIAIGETTDLRFYSRDVAGNVEAVQTVNYVQDVPTVASGYLGPSVSINSFGEVVWTQQDPNTSTYEIFSSTRGQLTSDGAMHNAVAVNSLGDMAWTEYDSVSGGNVVRAIIGGQAVLVASNQNWISSLALNDRREVVWSQQDWSGAPQIFSSTRGQLTSGVGHDSPSINNQGDVVYLQYDQQWVGQVYKLTADGSAPVQVTNDGRAHFSTAINDSGEIVWSDQDPNDQTSTTRLVSSVRGVMVPAAPGIRTVSINSCGDVAYSATTPNGSAIYRSGNNAPCMSYGAPHGMQDVAAPVAFGGIFSGLVDAATGSTDWYRFDAAAGDNIHIIVNYDATPPNALTIGLYDGQGNLVSGPAGSNPLTIDTLARVGGTYYLKLVATGGRAGFRVSLSRYTNNCGAGPCPETVASGNLGPSVSINALGEIVWSQWDNNSMSHQIFSSTRGQLTNDGLEHSNVAINSMGDMVWTEWDNATGSHVLRGVIGGQAAEIVRSQNWISKVVINDRREVVWSQRDWSGAIQIFSSTRGQLTSGAAHDSPSINNQGEVVYLQFDDPWVGQIYKLPADGSPAVKVVNDDRAHFTPAINDSGEIVWFDQEPNSPSFRLVSSVRGVILPLVSAVNALDINSCGTIAYGAISGKDMAVFRFGASSACVSYGSPHGTQELASPTGFGSFFSGLVDAASSSTDWYRFDAAAGDTIHIIVNYDATPPNALAIGLYDGQGNLVSGPAGSNPLTIDTLARVGGTYYLKLVATGGRAGYRVSLSRYTNNCGAGPCPETVASGNLGSSVSINALGEIVWSQWDNNSMSHQIFSSTRGQLTKDGLEHSNVAINSMGDMVWTEYDNATGSYVLRGVIGGQAVEIVRNQNWISKAVINDRREVVWSQRDWSGANQVFSSTRGQLTSGVAHDSPSINDQGEVVYLQFDDPWVGQIYKLPADGSPAVKMVNDDRAHFTPAINGSGEIVWFDQEPNSPGFRLVSSVRGVILPAVSAVNALDINSCGTIAYGAISGKDMTVFRLGASSACVSYGSPHGTQDLASPVGFGGFFSGLVDAASSSTDWYRFDAASGDNIHIIVNYDATPPNALTIGLYDGQGNLVSGPAGANPLAIDAKASSDGTYFLKLVATGGRPGYRVSLSKYTNNCGAGPCPEVVVSGQLSGGVSINSLGEIVWGQNDQNLFSQLFSSTRGQLTSEQNQHYTPAINNVGDMVWTEFDPTLPGVVLRGVIGGQPVTIARGSYGMSKVDINDSGEVVWSQPDGAFNTQIYSNLRGQLTSDATSHDLPSINNQGDVVFQQYDQSMPGPVQIYKLAAGTTTPVAITTDASYHYGPAINDSGEVVWSQQDQANPYSSQLVSSVRGILIPAITNINGTDLNNCGDVVYTTFGSTGQSIYRLGSGAPCVTYAITATAGANGSISGPSSVKYGANAVYTITPAAGSYVADVTVDGVSAGAVTSYTFSKVAANHTIAATFGVTTYSIAASSDGNGSVTGPATVNYGENAAFTITPATNYRILDVTVDGADAGAVASYTFAAVTANHTIAARFSLVPASSVTLTSVPVSPQVAGASIVLNAAAAGGSGNYEYRFGVSAVGSTVAVAVGPYGASSSHVWNTAGLTPGTYTLSVYARNVGSTATYEAAKWISFTLAAYPPVSSVTFTTTPASPQVRGTSVTLKGVASGGSGNYEYKFGISAVGNTNAVAVGPYSSSSSYVWNTANLTPGTYTLSVYARNVGSTATYEAAKWLSFTVAAYGPASSVTFTTTPASPQVRGTLVTLKASASGGSGNYEYKFGISAAGSSVAVAVGPYSSSSSYVWDTTGLTPGTYTLSVYARNVGSSATYEAAKWISFTVAAYGPASSVTFTTTQTSPQVKGTSVTLKGAASGGSGNYEYKFGISAVGSTVAVAAGPYSTSSTYAWDTTSLTPGSYTLSVYARNVGSTATYEAAKWISFTVSAYPPASAVSFATTPASPQVVGSPVTLKGTATGGSGNYEYKFGISAVGSTNAVAVGPYGASSSYAWDTAGLTPGTYTLSVFARNVGSSAPYEAAKWINFTLK
nr:6-bladed beta-propeller [Geomonas sp. Red32]